MNLSFKNRIALHYLIATATLTAVVFVIIFQVVRSSVYLHVDNDLLYEAYKHTKLIKLEGDQVIFSNKAEWEEREHREAEVNPVFLQVVGLQGEVMDKSPNLKEDFLDFGETTVASEPFDALLKDRSIRQVQVPLNFNDRQKGYLVTAMSLENSLAVLARLQMILLFTFPFVLLLLFFITRMIAAQSIRPISVITQTADNITRNNLNERIELPKNRDELFSLTTSINRLLDRLEQALEREKQFTADASHELRTPLTVLKGTLEVLIRKPREREEYESKVQDAIQEINRMGHSVEQLLTLARVDNMRRINNQQEINLVVLLDEIVQRYSKSIQQKDIKFRIENGPSTVIYSDPNLVDLLMDNIVSNAVKYSKEGGAVNISFQQVEECLVCKVSDEGIGIRSEDIDKVYTPFFRSDALSHKKIGGNGLGLAIVKKIGELIQVHVDLQSQLGKGTQVNLSFPLAGFQN
ncbi:sensor histidine kinase [Flavilitoribacter nigricans]|uniref:histidine kinase n=1 Tax=Flavilitoribacter nigricans (strain ATCC 23147 / DSM 23189 / NBRC 102662 / NCIMB 1420 / SS-2) TaxID=1122177 RepID=A0A2D0NCU7_FLAN2|nr:HAMP domain-containing sensor histidine kinase [Flavilitoribacter nigricans]PHN06334.1 two-component sensor histidine kinase [Flavilitoribacter nigricans DSM 23189 = NBRC 102662]